MASTQLVCWWIATRRACPSTRWSGSSVRWPAGWTMHTSKDCSTATSSPPTFLLTHLDDDGEQRILLTDFGIARNLDDISGLTTTNLTVRTRKNGGLRAIGVVGRLRLCLGAERSVGRSAGCAGPAGGTGPSDVAHRAGQLRGPTFPRHPAALAQQALIVQQSSSNRLALGIGLSHKPVIETGFGLSFSHPIRHLREYLTVLTPLLAGRAVQMSGPHYRVQQEPSVPQASAGAGRRTGATDAAPRRRTGRRHRLGCAAMDLV